MAQLLDAVRFVQDMDIVHGQLCLDTVLVKRVKRFQIELEGFAKVVNHDILRYGNTDYRDGHGPSYWEEVLRLHDYRTEGYRHQPSYKPVDI